MTRTRFVPVGGFLGAGKTTTFLRAAQELQARGEVVAIVTNDQGEDLVDTETSRTGTGVAVGEVTGGCFCCRFDDLAEVVDRLIDSHRPTVVLAEAVGSCTDLQSTVVRPLRALRGDQLDVTPLAVVIDPARYRSLRASFGADGADTSDLAHLYHHQLAEADVLALNKADTIGPAECDELCADIAARFPSARVLAYSAATGEHVDELLHVWGQPAPERPSPFAVDYERYGAAEAQLAWTNQVFDVQGSGFTPDDWLDQLLADLATGLAADDALVGHVKVRVASAHGCAKASLLSARGPASRDESDPSPTDRATALVNARVAAAPERLDGLIATAVRTADARCAATSTRLRGDVFRPAFPTPTHRR